MLKRFLPRQEGFFQLFQKTADILVLTATQFHILLLNLDHQQKYVDAIAQHEEEGDKLAHDTYDLLHKTFITPFDRHDIHRLTSQLDDVLDLVNRCAQCFPYYNLKEVPAEMISLADIAVQCTKVIKKAIYRLHTLKKSSEILSFCEEIAYLESQSHTLVLSGEKNLFEQEADFKQFFKLKETYARIKDVVSRCEDVANIIKGIVLEYS